MKIEQSDDIEVLGEVSSRSDTDARRIAMFVTLLRDGGLESFLPPRVVSEGERILLFDGSHRFEALAAAWGRIAVAEPGRSAR